jgi:UDP-glucose 4-epimerase
MNAGKMILVTGGAGYIGSHTSRRLVEAGYKLVVLDNLYSGHRWAVADEAVFVEGSAGDEAIVDQLIKQYDVSAVVHFAGHIVVPESVENPLKYYRNNCLVSQKLVESCRRNGVGNFLFSSSAAVYGLPDVIPVPENAPTRPINPYGATKLITEWLLRDVAQSTAADTVPFRYTALRYFNVAGAAIDGSLGQATPEATHLIKVACEAATGKRDGIRIFGTDYDTPDGTCIRDYIHVEDLAEAHVVVLDSLLAGGESGIYNCGYGSGYSVREVVDMVRQVSGVNFRSEEAPRRAGDARALIADSGLLQSQLGWRPRYNELELICRTAYDWEKGDNPVI